jgi:hypothetical protein
LFLISVKSIFISSFNPGTGGKNINKNVSSREYDAQQFSMLDGSTTDTTKKICRPAHLRARLDQYFFYLWKKQYASYSAR